MQEGIGEGPGSAKMIPRVMGFGPIYISKFVRKEIMIARYKVISMYLSYLAGDGPSHWLQLLPWAKYCYKTSFHSSLRLTPFKVIYDCEPLSLHAYMSGEARLRAVHHQLLEHDEFLLQVHERPE
jgi:hypothetical protein